MRRLLLAFVALLPAMSPAQAAPVPACQPASPFRLGLDHLDGYRFYKGPGGDTEVAPMRIEARQVPMLKTGKSLSILNLPLAHTRGDEIVVGAPDVQIGMHPVPAKEMFIMPGGSVTVTTPKFPAGLYPGSVRNERAVTLRRVFRLLTEDYEAKVTLGRAPDFSDNIPTLDQ